MTDNSDIKTDLTDDLISDLAFWEISAHNEAEYALEQIMQRAKSEITRLRAAQSQWVEIEGFATSPIINKASSIRNIFAELEISENKSFHEPSRERREVMDAVIYVLKAISAPQKPLFRRA